MSDSEPFDSVPLPTVAGALFLPGFEDLQIEDDPEGLEESAEMGAYTAAQFCRREPFRARLAIKLLARGVGQLEVAELVGCHVRTVRRLLESMPEEIATETERLNRRIRMGRKVALESILADLEDAEKMQKTPTRDKAVVLGILGDQLKTREPSVTINIQAPGHGDLAAYLAKLQPAEDAMALPPETGLGHRQRAAKGAALPFAGEDAEVGEDAEEKGEMT